MKIALPIEDNQLSPHFGRCEKFMIVEIENGEIKGKEIIENTAKEGMHGAGTTSASLIANMGANTIIVQNIGPRHTTFLNSLALMSIKLTQHLLMNA